MRILLSLALLLPGCAAKVTVPVAATADIVTTEVALVQPGNVELNPVLQNRAAWISVKVAAAIVVVVIADNLRRDGHPGWSAFIQWFATGLWGGAAAWNVSRRTQ
jgi:hypothetical protein